MKKEDRRGRREGRERRDISFSCPFSGNSKAGFAPIAIGLTLGALTLIGGAFNPARATGPGERGE